MFLDGQLRDLEQLEESNKAVGKRLQEVCAEAESLLQEIREAIRIIATTQAELQLQVAPPRQTTGGAVVSTSSA